MAAEYWRTRGCRDAQGGAEVTKKKDESTPFNAISADDRVHYQALARIEKYEAVFVELQKLLSSYDDDDIGRARELLIKTMQEREK